MRQVKRLNHTKFILFVVQLFNKCPFGSEIFVCRLLLCCQVSRYCRLRARHCCLICSCAITEYFQSNCVYKINIHVQSRHSKKLQITIPHRVVSSLKRVAALAYTKRVTNSFSTWQPCNHRKRYNVRFKSFF